MMMMRNVLFGLVLLLCCVCVSVLAAQSIEPQDSGALGGPRALESEADTGQDDLATERSKHCADDQTESDSCKNQTAEDSVPKGDERKNLNTGDNTVRQTTSSVGPRQPTTSD
ncbi:uncharacterized protein TM35_001311000, partial [Trypanosoma theileri]